jgi:hypothetical protein
MITKLNTLKVWLDQAPPLPYLIGLMYDWEATPPYVWFDEKAGTNLRDRFKVSQCPTVLFFKEGERTFYYLLNFYLKKN